jgi:acetyltransferase-like isoleucine patch superfamily enzyme
VIGGLPVRARRLSGSAIAVTWEAVCRLGRIEAGDRRARRFGSFGAGSVIGFPTGAMFGERWIQIGRGTLIAPDVTLSAGMGPDQVMVTDPVVRIGDGCLIGRGSAVVGHLSIDIGSDVFFGMNVYVTDQNHGYERLDIPISQQIMPERPVTIGNGSWLGHGTVVLPGASIGSHVVVGANSVVTGALPDNCVAVGAPARVLRLLG